MNKKFRTESRDKKRGFTLTELNVVIVLLLIMMGLTAPAMSSFMKRTQVKTEAERLASLLRSARQYALSNGTHTRVVFADADLEEFTEGRMTENGAYGAYAFYKPTLPSGGSDYKPFAEADGLTPEFASMPFTSIPSGFVGQFIPLPGSETWRTVDARVKMVGFIPEEAKIKSGYNREFFDESNILVETETTSAPPQSHRLISQLYYNPSKFWDYDGRAYYLPNIPNAQYPKNYYQTPFPEAYPRITTRLMPNEPSIFEADDRILTYDELWSGQAELVYFDEITEFTSLGEPDTASPTDENKKFFDLRGIEFSPKGQPTINWADEVVFQFQPDTERSTPAYDVVIDRNTGLANVRLARTAYVGETADDGGTGDADSGTDGT